MQLVKPVRFHSPLFDDGPLYPICRNGKTLKKDKYLLVTQVEQEPEDGFNLVIQDLEPPYYVHLVQSIDFEDEEE